jgi:N-acetyl-gamma-glutamyl-phosphate reductase
MEKKMIKAGIVGGTGYTAGELIWLLLGHPELSLEFVYSRSRQGEAISKIHPELSGETDLQFSGELAVGVDVLFLCLPHGQSKAFLQEHRLSASTKIIDLSHDFRLKREEEHGFVYGLPELNKQALKEAQRVANPGCFATGIQLALLPLAKAGLLQQEVHVHAITGATGAGAGTSATTHFSYRSNNLSVYKAFAHQHMAEIRESLQQLDTSFMQDINFIPLRGDFARGIFASLYTEVDVSLQEAKSLYRDFYQDAPFVTMKEEELSLKEVVNTNRCFLQLQQHGKKLLIISAIDNLLKGASGQAVQNMNLLFGLAETTGLQLKPVKF